MNTESVDKLKHSAETGNIDLLYEVIQHDPYILEFIDNNTQFVETPLHIAASMGQLEFAIEIMNLKPSFATKLNLQGYSPIHVAMNRLRPAMDNPIDPDMASNINVMVSKLVGINKDLVRVKGREGLTPMHIACQNGEVDLLAKFLNACPDSIEDENVSGESALHIAVKSNQNYALKVLLGWLRKNYQRGAGMLETKILNHKDKAGNTVYHISALSDDPEFLALLVQHFAQFPAKFGIELNALNLKNQTAVDLASTPQKKKMLEIFGVKNGSKITKDLTPAEELSSQTSAFDNIITGMRRIRRNISEEQRNTWLIVATLVATATYESALNPPGGVFQVSSSDDNNVKIKSTDLYYSTRGNAGKSILSKNSFAVFSSANLISFATSTLVMIILTPSEALGDQLFGTVLWFGVCYLTGLLAISPTHANSIILYILISFIAFVVSIFWIFSEYFGYKQSKKIMQSLRNLLSK
ncbi:ankyrin repeat-containing protein BDA1-like [Vicia villosa]|uniref:ankyrin repeat-containing protein BDA1-like n=1 Tax=Vicia villosa TaxID=3911 RepID=UPI00273B4CAA|nr:ankyrin repeat-containing protein BDA1-like [Vicia villosa]